MFGKGYLNPCEPLKQNMAARNTFLVHISKTPRVYSPADNTVEPYPAGYQTYGEPLVKIEVTLYNAMDVDPVIEHFYKETKGESEFLTNTIHKGSYFVYKYLF